MNHIVYHLTNGGARGVRDFSGTRRECMDWMQSARETGDRTNYFLKVR